MSKPSVLAERLNTLAEHLKHPNIFSRALEAPANGWCWHGLLLPTQVDNSRRCAAQTRFSTHSERAFLVPNEFSMIHFPHKPLRRAVIKARQILQFFEFFSSFLSSNFVAKIFEATFSCSTLFCAFRQFGCRIRLKHSANRARKVKSKPGSKYRSLWIPFQTSELLWNRSKQWVAKISRDSIKLDSRSANSEFEI